ncbi:hypothetical protein [Streptomyces noursei]|uniref:hypothetical protein n=1 Tax=Streptomyces noursei TaxID=1971 RepID=UPI0005C8C8C3|nr:hypothetical protein [Streptomyces noursei]
MFHRIRPRRRVAELQQQTYEAYLRIAGQAPVEDAPTQPASAAPGEPAAVVDDFLPPELRVPSHDEVEGRMMPWPWPVVLDDEVVACAECGAYRDWLVLSTRDQIWLRCRAGHQQHETRLDTAWYNRHAGPVDSTHATFEDCLRHLDH